MNPNPRWKHFAFVGYLAYAALFGATVFALDQSQHARKPAAPPAKTRRAPAPPAEATVPFHAGEKLSYRVMWSKFSVNAGTLDFLVAQHGTFFSHVAWHFQARAQTVDTMHIVYPLDDQFDSYTEGVKLASLQYEMYLHEQGKQQNNSWRMTVDGSEGPSDATAARVLPGTRDPIGFLYALRATDWKSTPVFRTPVFDGHNLYDVEARLGLAAGHVTVPAGEFDASRVDVHLSEHSQQVADTSFSVWIAQDASRTPVLIEASVPVGTARVELTSH